MRLLVFLLLTTHLALAGAQESAAIIEEEAVPEKDPADDKKTVKKTDTETPDTFDATEKLSEDIPAPFPVDI